MAEHRVAGRSIHQFVCALPSLSEAAQTSNDRKHQGEIETNLRHPIGGFLANPFQPGAKPFSVPCADTDTVAVLSASTNNSTVWNADGDCRARGCKRIFEISGENATLRPCRPLGRPFVEGEV